MGKFALFAALRMVHMDNDKSIDKVLRIKSLGLF